MPTYSNIRTTPKSTSSEMRSSRTRSFITTAVLLTAIIATAIIVTVASLAEPREPSHDPGDRVGTAIVFGVPLAQYTSILKNASLTEHQYNETMKRWESHKMVTLAAPLGTPVLATFAGTVTAVHDHTMFGRQIVIQHRDGLQTIYSNLDRNTIVSVGTRVEKGQEIGKVGQTSNIEFTTTPHLRVEVLRDGKRVDPNDFIDFPIK